MCWGVELDGWLCMRDGCGDMCFRVEVRLDGLRGK